MKKNIITLVVLMSAVFGLMAQNKMIVNLKSGTKVEYAVQNIESVTWEIGEQPGDQPGDPQEGEHEFVDLGLPSGLKWATCNVGASAPEEYGDYYAWGEIETKDEYYVGNYAYHHIGTDADGFEIDVWDNLGDISGTEYDVARHKWGGFWRMPTQSEFKELVNNCTWEWGKKNKVNGYKVTGSNGNWIFLPAAGYRGGTDLYSENMQGYYWSSTSNPSKQGSVFNLLFSSSHIISNNNHGSANGQSVRPVTE